MTSPSTPPAPPTSAAHPAIRPGLVLFGVLALAVNLRAGLAGYPPLLATARKDLGISAGAAGLVQSGAVLMMSAGSFVASGAASRIGRELLLGIAVASIGAGSLLRIVPALPALIGGSVLVGLGIGIAGVLVTGVVKERLAERAGAVTGGYVVSMMIGATIASATAVPMAVALGGWSLSLSIWAIPAVLAVAVWIPIGGRIGRAVPVAAAGVMSTGAGSTGADATGGASVSAEPPIWREPFARQAACYLAGSSLMFYGWLTWLSPFYESQGWSPQAAGLLLAVWSIAQIPAALLFPAAAERRRRWRFWASLAIAGAFAGLFGALLLPEPGTSLPWLWSALIGIAGGAGFPLGLAVIAWRTPTPARSAAVSGFALGIGYLAAGIGPLVMGLLIDTGGFPPAIVLLLGAAVLQAGAIWRIGDRRE